MKVTTTITEQWAGELPRDLAKILAESEKMIPQIAADVYVVIEDGGSTIRYRYDYGEQKWKGPV